MNKVIFVLFMVFYSGSLFPAGKCLDAFSSSLNKSLGGVSDVQSQTLKALEDFPSYVTPSPTIQKLKKLLSDGKVKHVGGGVFEFTERPGVLALRLQGQARDTELFLALEKASTGTYVGKAQKVTTAKPLKRTVTTDAARDLGSGNSRLALAAKGQFDEAIPYLKSLDPDTLKVIPNPRFKNLYTTCGRVKKPFKVWRRTSASPRSVIPKRFNYHGRVPSSQVLNTHLSTSKGEYMGLATLMDKTNSWAGGGGKYTVPLCVLKGALVCVVGGVESELVLMDKGWKNCIP